MLWIACLTVYTRKNPKLIAEYSFLIGELMLISGKESTHVLFKTLSVWKKMGGLRSFEEREIHSFRCENSQQSCVL